MKTITIEVPEDLGAAVAASDEDLPQALRLAAAIPRSGPKPAYYGVSSRHRLLDFSLTVGPVTITPWGMNTPLRRAARRAMALGLVGLLWAGRATGQPQAPQLNPSVADRFEVTTFASGLDFPKSLQLLPDGSFLVGTSRSDTGNLFNSTGELVRLIDADHDGQADGPGQVLASGLPGAITSVRRAGDLVFVASSLPGSERITAMRLGATPSDPLALVGNIDLEYPAGWQHTTSGMAVREVAGQPGQFELFFNVGSRDNATRTTATVPISGLVDGVANADSIYRVTVQDSGGTPAFTGLEQVAAGLRNASGLAFHPGSGDLVFDDNGIDGLVNPDEPFSADELNRIVGAQIGGPVEDFGFPDAFVPYRTGGQGGAGDDPLVAFQPIPDPLTGSESEGPAEIAFAPASFQPILGDGLFVGFHGRFNLGGLANEENPLVFYSLATDSYFHFFENDQPGIGHLDGLLSTPDALYVADLSSTGDLFNSRGTGVIYRIRAVPEPSAVVLIGLGGLALGSLALRRRDRPAARRSRPTLGSDLSDSIRRRAQT